MFIKQNMTLQSNHSPTIFAIYSFYNWKHVVKVIWQKKAASTWTVQWYSPGAASVHPTQYMLSWAHPSP